MTRKTDPAVVLESARVPQAPVERVYGDLRFHTDGELQALAFGPAVDNLWSVEDPGILRRWNGATGQQLGSTFLSDVETLWSFSQDARLLASASDELSLWDVFSGRLLASLPQPSWVTGLAFAGNARLLATGHDDGVTRVWDVLSRKLVREFRDHRLPVSALAFSPDDAWLASAGEDRRIDLWEVATGNRLGSFTGHTDRIQDLAWHPRGHLLVSAGWDTTARVWNTATFEPVILLNGHADQVTALAFSPDGRVLACADSANAVRLWEPEAGKQVGVLQQHEDEVRCLAFSADGRLLASGGADRVIHLWDPRENRQLSGRGKPQVLRSSLVVTPDSRRLVSTCGGASLQVWDIASAGLAFPAIEDGALPVAACSPDGRWLAAGGSDNRIRLWDAATGQPELPLVGQAGRVAALAFAPDGQSLASASATDGLVWVWNLRTREPALVIPEAADNCMVETLAFHPAGRILAAGGIDWLATGGSDGAICLWDVLERSLLATLDGGTACLAFHPTGRWLAAGSLEESIFVWEVDTQQLALELLGHTETITCVAFSPDGNWLASGSDDRTLRLWNVRTGQPVSVHACDTQIKALCFSPDGRFLFTGNGNTTSYQLDLRRVLAEEP